MKVRIISCSKKAYELGERLRRIWEETDPEVRILHKTKTKMLPEISMKERVEDFVEEQFPESDLLLFICASGIAVRSVAPLLKHKSKDPAVLVMDETGRYCISLLSGHAGGANFYAEQIASMTGAEPVITTATDREGMFAVDEFARKNGLVIRDWKKAKDISVRVLSGEPVGISSDFPVRGKMPAGLHKIRKDGKDETEIDNNTVSELTSAVRITNRRDREGEKEACLKLIVPNVILGIGCRKNTPEEQIESAVTQFLENNDRDLHAVKKLVSIDLKAEEEGILAFAGKHNLEFSVCSAEELSALEGDFSESSFVENITGVSNVCERAAVSGGGELIVKKTCFPQVTLAMAELPVDLEW